MRTASLLCTGVVAVAVAACASRSEDLSETQQLIRKCDDLPAVADSTVSALQMRSNFGGRPVLQVGGLRSAVLRFDLSSIPPGAAIDSATLDLWVSDADRSWPIYVNRVTAPWT